MILMIIFKQMNGENKAGAYAIQGYAERFVKTLNGSYSNVSALPLYQAVQFAQNQ